MKPSLIIKDTILFFDAPPDIEGSPYWVDLWTEVNGYMIGLQVKPGTYNSASISIYCGKSKSSQKNGFRKFAEKYKGRVFTVVPENGRVDKETEDEISDEYNRLKNLQPGEFSYDNY